MGTSLFDVEAETQRLLREADAAVPNLMRQVEGDAAGLMPEIEAEAARFHADLRREMRSNDERGPEPRVPLGLHDHDRDNLPRREGHPSWMSPEDWERRVARYREQGRTEQEIAETSAYLEERGPRQPRTRAEGIARSEEIGIVTRDVFVPKDEEARYLARDEDGLPTVRLVDAGDRLAIWSPLEGGALINPKGPGLRQSLGLCTSYARGADHYATAYRNADLRQGRWIDLQREPENPHDRNAVAMCAPGSLAPIGYVSRGRAPAVARRMDKGEDMAGVTIWGPSRGRDDRSTLVLIGSRTDLAAMLG